jgi:hypothetical protein
MMATKNPNLTTAAVILKTLNKKLSQTRKVKERQVKLQNRETRSSRALTQIKLVRSFTTRMANSIGLARAVALLIMKRKHQRKMRKRTNQRARKSTPKRRKQNQTLNKVKKILKVMKTMISPMMMMKK